MLGLILFLIFVTVFVSGYFVFPFLYQWSLAFGQKREQQLSGSMENILSRSEVQKWSRIFMLAPIVIPALCYLLAPAAIKIPATVLGLAIGFIFPKMYVKVLLKKTRERFNDQLIDSLMIMSSSFRGGLSLIQAFEAVVEEMPDPTNREFGTVLGENKMGVSLEEALNHLYDRMPLIAVQQLITAILLARETGGNLPVIFTRIVNNIRERKKIQQNIDTLTLQGKIQGVVMSILPIAFAAVVYNTNRRIFDHMMASDLGRMLLILATVLWIVGVFMIWKISTFKDY